MWTEVIKAEYLDGYRIMVSFNDGVRRIVDFADLINRFPVFKALVDIDVFKQFHVTDTLEWKNGDIDIAPEYLYENGLPV